MAELKDTAETLKQAAENQQSREEATLMAAMGLIANGGNAKSLAFEAIRLAKVGKIKEAREKLEEAKGETRELSGLDHSLGSLSFPNGF